MKLFNYRQWHSPDREPAWVFHPFLWQKSAAANREQVNARWIGLCTCVCVTAFLCVYIYICFFSVCVCGCASHLCKEAHILMPSCEPSYNCCQSNPPNTPKQTQRLCSPLASEDLQHPKTPKHTHRSGIAATPQPCVKQKAPWSGRWLSKPLNRLIVPLFSPRCRLNWPLQPHGLDLSAELRARQNRHDEEQRQSRRGGGGVHVYCTKRWWVGVGGLRGWRQTVGADWMKVHVVKPPFKCHNNHLFSLILLIPLRRWW